MDPTIESLINQINMNEPVFVIRYIQSGCVWYLRDMEFIGKDKIIRKLLWTKIILDALRFSEVEETHTFVTNQLSPKKVTIVEIRV